MRTLQRNILNVNMDDFRETLAQVREGDILDFGKKGRELVTGTNHPGGADSFATLSREGPEVISGNCYFANPEDRRSIDGKIEWRLNKGDSPIYYLPRYEFIDKQLLEAGL